MPGRSLPSPRARDHLPGVCTYEIPLGFIFVSGELELFNQRSRNRGQSHCLEQPVEPDIAHEVCRKTSATRDQERRWQADRLQRLLG